MGRLAAQEAVRHDRIDEVIESTVVRAIYGQLDEFDFSTDESVAPAGRSGATRVSRGDWFRSALQAGSGTPVRLTFLGR
jgi:hypothetical protein